MKRMTEMMVKLTAFAVAVMLLNVNASMQADDCVLTNVYTTQEIRAMADRLTDVTRTDADDIVQDRKGTVSLLSGPKPEIRSYPTVADEVAGVAAWLDHLAEDLKIPGRAVAIFYRSENERGRAEDAIAASVYGEERFDRPRVAEMFEAKGLEYRAAVVMACDNDVMFSQAPLGIVGAIRAWTRRICA